MSESAGLLTETQVDESRGGASSGPGGLRAVAQLVLRRPRQATCREGRSAACHRATASAAWAEACGAANAAVAADLEMQEGRDDVKQRRPPCNTVVEERQRRLAERSSKCAIRQAKLMECPPPHPHTQGQTNHELVHPLVRNAPCTPCPARPRQTSPLCRCRPWHGVCSGSPCDAALHMPAA